MFEKISHRRCALMAQSAMNGAMQKLFVNERGAAIIELAIIAPIFALMTIGVVDMSNAYSRKLSLEQGAQRAIEKIMQTTQGETVEDTLKTEAVCQVNGTNTDGTCKSSPITTDNVTVTFRLECTNSDGSVEVHTDADAATDCASNQTQAQYVTVQVTDKYTPMFPIHFAGYNRSDGTYHISATAGMRTQ
jgi:Flp pilus assembly protein TadG